jgi:hypothetical protein
MAEGPGSNGAIDSDWPRQKHVYLGDAASLQPALHYALLAGRFESTAHAVLESSRSALNATQLHTHAHPIATRGGRAQSTLWFPGGHPDYDRLRPLAYPGTDVMLLCYNRRDLATLHRVRDYWLDECSGQDNEYTPVLLLGLDDEQLSKAALAERGYYDPLGNDEGGAEACAEGERELLREMVRIHGGGIERKTGRRSGRSVGFMAVNLWDQPTVQTIPVTAYWHSQTNPSRQPPLGRGRCVIC